MFNIFNILNIPNILNILNMIVIMWMQIESNSVSFVDPVLSYDKTTFRHIYYVGRVQRKVP